jgi:hypothetical protein
MEPTTVECSTACTITVVHELSLPPLQLTVEEGGAIATAIVGVWVVGWIFGQLIRMVRQADKVEADE